MLEQSMARAFESHQRYDRQSSNTLETKISEDSKIYFPTHVKTQVEETCQKENGNCDWESMVRFALKEVYDDNIANYTAKGHTKGSNGNKRPQIDNQLYNAIFGWVREKVGPTQIITTKMFNRAINKFSYNKRTNDNMKPNCSNKSEEADLFSEENLQFFKKIVKIAEESFNMQQRELLPERQLHQLADVFTQPSKNNVKISPNYEVYLPQGIYLFISRHSETARGEYNWRTLVKTTLLEIYGNDLKKYSAKGTRGGCPPINVELYRALYDWASSQVEKIILEDEFVDYINDLTANKRKGKNK
ncbi:Protein of unknown function [Cotesia congregata]|uniref:Uncharacterized protein n=1 Tax=Cotesia congregata TaxID=51543 RepID=A0A8J2HAD9_COTCN|nr:Protein of unknown function [Cotesia congregata]